MNLTTVGWASSSLRLLARLISSGVNSTTPVTAISEAATSATNADIALVAKGTGATLAQVPDGTVAGGNKRGTFATDLQKVRTAATHVASGIRAVVVGGVSNSATNTDSVVVGGNGNNSITQLSFVGGGQSNNVNTNTHGVVCGGNTNTSTGQYAFVGGGSSNTASATASVASGGGSNVANGSYSFIGGGVSGNARSIIGYHVFPACLQPIASTSGCTQAGLLLLARETTNNTSTVLTCDNQPGSTGNQVILPNNSAYSFSGEVIAGVTGAGNTARWTINGAIKRGATAASTALVGTPTVTMTHNDTGAAGWTVTITADTTNGGIAVTVNGQAATTIRWVCKINTTEMTY